MQGDEKVRDMNANAVKKVRVIDSHTGGEPTRLVVAGGPDLGEGSLSDSGVGGQAPVVAAIAALSTADAVTQAKAAAKAGSNALMVLPPYVTGATGAK